MGDDCKVIRAYLTCATRLIRAHGGEIRSFDGDRVMGVFMGDYKNTNAVTCARNIDWTVNNLINTEAKERFPSIQKNDIRIKHCVGVDSGVARAVRAGIRGSNDLIWIGRAPSLAAKLSDVREFPYEVIISDEVFKKMNDTNKTKVDGVSIWEERSFSYAGEATTIHRTKTTLAP